MKKSILAITIAAIFVMGSTAFAEDGFKMFLGYSLGKLGGKITYYDESSGDSESDKTTGTVHGPSVDARYESGPFFIRGTFDYNWLASGKIKSESDSVSIKGHLMKLEVDLGYKVINQKDISLTPYIGVGHYNGKVSNKDVADEWISYTTPYAALGVLTVHDAAQWSIGLDAALLMPFSGKFKAAGEEESLKAKTGLGARVQVPVTYTIIPKKGNSFGLMAFVTPSYEYINSGKSKSYEDFKVKLTNGIYGVKTGIGFAF